MGNISSTFAKADSAYILAHRQFMSKNKQLTLLCQCKLAFTGIDMFMALKILKDMKKILTAIYPFMSSKAQFSL
jgi:hypothetical protein